MLVGLVAFLVWSEGIPAYQRSQPVPAVSGSEPLALPERIHNPSPNVASTQTWGPPGPVGIVFQGRTAREGFTGEVGAPWYTVSARDGGYRRLAAPHLEEADGGLWLSAQGTGIAWAWPGGIQTYDTVSGESRSYPKAAGVDPGSLAWSPDQTMIAFGTDPVRVLDTGTGEVTEQPLRAPEESSARPVWTDDGRWLTIPFGDAIEGVDVETGQRRTLPVGLDGLRQARWSRDDALAGLRPGATGQFLQVVRTHGWEGRDATASAVDTGRPRLVIEGLLGWAGADEVVLVGLQPETGSIEQAMAYSLTNQTLRPYMVVPTLGDNWAGIGTVSVAGDLLERGTRAFPRPGEPWSSGAKLLTCMLVAVFPTVYFVIARRPRRR